MVTTDCSTDFTVCMLLYYVFNRQRCMGTRTWDVTKYLPGHFTFRIIDLQVQIKKKLKYTVLRFAGNL